MKLCNIDNNVDSRLTRIKSVPFYQNIRGKHEDLGHAVRVYGLSRVLVLLLVDETMPYRKQCRFTINQNLRVYHFFPNIQGKYGDLGHTVRVYGLIRVLVFLLVGETMQYRQQRRFRINQNLRVYHSIKIFEEITGTLVILCVCTV